MDMEDARWWQSEIIKGARAFLDYFVYVLMVVVFLFVILFAYVVTFIPDGGSFGPLEVTKENVRYFLFLSNIATGGIGITSLVTIWKLRKPCFMRYQQSAVKIVEELRDQCRIDNKEQQKMLDLISRYLAPCTDPSRRKESEEGLLRVSVQLAQIAEQ